MKIEMGKKYRTRNGQPVRLLATDLKGTSWPVAAAITTDDGSETVFIYYPNGARWSGFECEIDLVEVGPYDDFKIGEPVMAKLFPTSDVGLRRYFAGVTQDGRPMVFNDGLTAWSSAGNRTICFSVRRPTEEELA